MSDSELNNNVSDKTFQTISSSMEDLSEYTDADESMSAPTEILAEFLSSIMLKDYVKALKYCKLILNYEPNNATAKEFYPLIVEKLIMIRNDEEYDDSSSESWDSSTSSSSSRLGSNKSSDSDATTASYSSFEEDEAVGCNNAVDPTNNYHSDTDIKNGNLSAQENLSTCSAREYGRLQQKEEKIKPKSSSTLSPSPKILIHPTPTVTIKQDTAFQLARTQTYTKSFSPTGQSPVKVNNLNQSVTLDSGRNTIEGSSKRTTLGSKVHPEFSSSSSKSTKNVQPTQ